MEPVAGLFTAPTGEFPAAAACTIAARPITGIMLRLLAGTRCARALDGRLKSRAASALKKQNCISQCRVYDSGSGVCASLATHGPAVVETWMAIAAHGRSLHTPQRALRQQRSTRTSPAHSVRWCVRIGRPAASSLPGATVWAYVSYVGGRGHQRKQTSQSAIHTPPIGKTEPLAARPPLRR